MPGARDTGETRMAEYDPAASDADGTAMHSRSNGRTYASAARSSRSTEQRLDAFEPALT
jgi:hypothetical protein